MRDKLTQTTQQRSTQKRQPRFDQQSINIDQVSHTNGSKIKETSITNRTEIGRKLSLKEAGDS